MAWKGFGIGMKITVCIGSACHLKGSGQIVEQLKQLIASNRVEEKVELSGAFCMGKCSEGVSVSVDGIVHSLTPETTEAFFHKEVLSKI